MKIFLDDFRQPIDCAKYMYSRIGAENIRYTEGNWLLVKNYQEFVNAVEQYYESITHISFDHDLADEHYDTDHSTNYKEKTGYDCAIWLKNFYTEHCIKLPVIYIHSINPVGVERIKSCFNK